MGGSAKREIAGLSFSKGLKSFHKPDELRQGEAKFVAVPVRKGRVQVFVPAYLVMADGIAQEFQHKAQGHRFPGKGGVEVEDFKVRPAGCHYFFED